MTETDVVIIGAGHNGLTCAAYLAMAGLRVRLVERRRSVGGAAVSIYRWRGANMPVVGLIASPDGRFTWAATNPGKPPMAIAGNYELATRCYQRAVAALSSCEGAQFGRYAAYLNLANSQYQTGHYAEGLASTIDLLLNNPQWSARVDPTQIGGFGASLGGESLLLMAGAGLTTSLGLSWTVVDRDPRLKMATTYIPYFGQPFFPAFVRGPLVIAFPGQVGFIMKALREQAKKFSTRFLRSRIFPRDDAGPW